jgi:hypothetical protein
MRVLSLTVAQQDALLQAHMQLDSYEVMQGDKVVRVPYKLGAERRSAAKNINALKRSLEIWNETRMAIVREHYPNKRDDEEVDKDKDPVQWMKFVADITVAANKQDAIPLELFSATVMYDSNEFPMMAIATLDEHGLIE